VNESLEEELMRISFRMVFLIVCFLLFLTFGISSAREVVIYTSLDQIFSEPVLRDYQKQTGVKVRAVYDVEAAKTTGLVNRLIAEKKRPKCDVFWNSEIGRTIVLKQKGILTPYRSPSAKDIPPQFIDKDRFWTGFAARARVLIYNINMLNPSDLPKSIFELTDMKWRDKVALAYPLFGTTATHVAAMYVLLGKQKTEKYLKNLHGNGVVIVDGNSVVRDLVVEGRLPIGFTDTDDVNVAIQSGKPVKMLYPDINGIGTLLIPNTVALIKNAPHAEEGKKLIDYLLSKQVESKLSFSESAQMPLRDDVRKPDHIPHFSAIKAMDVDFYKVADAMLEATRFCQKLFVR
jgi:iron(III) transport system substrate-binding protein